MYAQSQSHISLASRCLQLGALEYLVGYAVCGDFCNSRFTAREHLEAEITCLDWEASLLKAMCLMHSAAP